MARKIRTAPPTKRKRTSKKTPDENEDFKPDSESDTERVSCKSRRQAPCTKQVKTKQAPEDVKPVKRSARVDKLAQDKEAARQNAATANFDTRFHKLPGEIRNIIYEMCLENNEIDMTHDTLKPDGPFDGYAPGRALTQVSQQVRAEFLLVYKRTTTIRVHVEDLEEYIKTWLNGPASEGKIYVHFKQHYRDGRYRRAPGSFERSQGTVTVDLKPLLKLRRAEPKFQFWICNHDWDEGKADVVPSEQSEYIDDIVERVELRLLNWHIFSFRHFLKPGYGQEDCEKYTSDGSELDDWVGDIWMGVTPVYSLWA